MECVGEQRHHKQEDKKYGGDVVELLLLRHSVVTVMLWEQKVGTLQAGEPLAFSGVSGCMYIQRGMYLPGDGLEMQIV